LNCRFEELRNKQYEADNCNNIGYDFDLLRDLHDSNLDIHLGHLLALVPKYRKELFDSSMEDSQPKTLTCTIESTINWDMNVPKLIVQIVDIIILEVIINARSRLNIISNKIW